MSSSLLLRVLRRPTSSLNSISFRCASTSALSTATPTKPVTSGAPKSSCPAGTVLTGLAYLKGQAPVVALPDEEYPEWLWSVLEPKVYPDDGPGGKLERVTRKKARQQAIKDRNFMSTQ